MRYFKNPYEDFSGGGDPRDPYPDDAVKDDLERLLADIVSNAESYEGNYSGGVYVGPAGVAFALWYVSTLRKQCRDPGPIMKVARRLVRRHKRDMLEHRDKYRAGFLHGRSGVHAVHAVISAAAGKSGEAAENARAHAGICADATDPHFDGCDELLFGRAGYVCGALWIRKQLGTHGLGSDLVKLEDVRSVCKELIKSGRRTSRRCRSPCPLMFEWHDKQYLGAAHGISAILQMLLSIEGLAADEISDVRGTVDFLVTIQTTEGNLPSSMGWVVSHSGRERKEEDQLIHWCHGAAGVIYLFIRAYNVFGDQKYLTAALKCGECIWRKGLLKKGPGICHGVAGSGYAFLVLYRLTRDEKYLYRARCFAQFMMTSRAFAEEASSPDRPYSLYEGTAGTACFLADVLNPDDAEFPFFDIFS